MAKFIDLTASVFGKLTVLGRDTTQNVTTPVRWFCQCECGKQISALAGNLKKGNTKSCGCFRVEANSKVKPGMRFGRLQVLARDGSKRYGKVSMSMWHCACDCGNFKSVLGMSLMDGGTRSCGCLLRESVRDRASDVFIDLEGQEFGNLVVITRATPKGWGKGNIKWLCACKCGGLTILAGNRIQKGLVISCGCQRWTGKKERPDAVRIKSMIYGARRRSAELDARHPFDDELFELVEQEAYRLTVDRERVTGFSWNVHHVIPLRSNIVCGLHNEFNLAVIPASTNMSIGNRSWPDMP